MTAQSATSKLGLCRAALSRPGLKFEVPDACNPVLHDLLEDENRPQ